MITAGTFLMPAVDFLLPEISVHEQEQRLAIEEVWNPSILRRLNVSTFCQNGGIRFPTRNSPEHVFFGDVSPETVSQNYWSPTLLCCFFPFQSVLLGQSFHIPLMKKADFPFFCWSKITRALASSHVHPCKVMYLGHVWCLFFFVAWCCWGVESTERKTF